MRFNHSNPLSGEKSFIYAPPRHNVVSTFPHVQYIMILHVCAVLCTSIIIHFQRIEGWWSQLRRKTSWWINLFKASKVNNNYQHNYQPLQCTQGSRRGYLAKDNVFQRYGFSYFKDNLTQQYVALPILKQELTEYVQYWNSHLMRKNKSISFPSGVPNKMYEFPELYGEKTAVYYFIIMIQRV